VREGTRLDGGSPGLVIRVVLTALVFTGGRGTGSARSGLQRFVIIGRSLVVSFGNGCKPFGFCRPPG